MSRTHKAMMKVDIPRDEHVSRRHRYRYVIAITLALALHNRVPVPVATACTIPSTTTLSATAATPTCITLPCQHYPNHFASTIQTTLPALSKPLPKHAAAPALCPLTPALSAQRRDAQGPAAVCTRARRHTQAPPHPSSCMCSRHTCITPGPSSNMTFLSCPAARPAGHVHGVRVRVGLGVRHSHSASKSDSIHAKMIIAHTLSFSTTKNIHAGISSSEISVKSESLVVGVIAVAIEVAVRT